MGYFSGPEEVDQYIGEMFRQADHHPKVGPKMRAANVVMRVVYTDPECEMTVKFTDPMETTFAEAAGEPDITLSMPADIADRFWRGKYNLAVGLARSEVKAKGRVNKILKLVPLTEPLFPVYQDLIAQKDGEK